MLWPSQSIINLSDYVGDAITMKIPLLGGRIHDWNFLLGRFNILSSAPILGKSFYILGIIVILAAILIGLYDIFFKTRRNNKIN